jgi:hypothetical protein
MSETEFAKSRLRDHLSNLIIPPISEGLWSIYNSAKELCDKNNQSTEILRTFQNMLTNVPSWKQETLATEVERIQKVSKCTYLDDLIMGVFISYMKSFASLHYSENSEISVDFDRPTLGEFIHELYKQSARKLWQVAYLFRTVGVSTEQQARNRQDIEKVISECMEQVITSFLPWESITKKYFSQSAPPVEPSLPEPPKSVTFQPEDDEDEESVAESEDELKPNLVMSDEVASIEIKEFEVPKKEEEPPPKEEEEDAMEELSKKASDTLVLNL